MPPRAVVSATIIFQRCLISRWEEALTITNKKVVETLEGLPPQKIHCSVLAEEAIKLAIEDYKSKQG